MDEKHWHHMTSEMVMSHHSLTMEGLSNDSVQQSLEKHGYNRLDEAKKVSKFIRFISQYNDPLNYLLFGAALLALAIHPNEPGDAIFIFIVLTANAFFGFWQENQAEQAMDALKKMSVSHCVVIRDGIEIETSTEELVPGDLVRLEQGLNVPADLRLIESLQCKIDESALTGESDTVSKHGDVISDDTILAERKNMAYMGTVISSGRALGVVCNTGMSTELGKIASDIASAETPKTPLELKLESLGKFLGFIALVVAVLLVSIKLLLSYNVPGVDMVDVAVEQFIIAIAIFVAIVPEGLPIILVTTLAIGMRNMARHKAIIRRMKAVETLGSTTVICTDKTGTLTKNQMTVREFALISDNYGVTGEGFTPLGTLTKDSGALNDSQMSMVQKNLDFRLAATCLSLCHNSQIVQSNGEWITTGDPTDLACAVLGWKLNGNIQKFAQRHSRLHEFFFDSERKRMSVVHEYEGKEWVFSKGSAKGYKNLISSKIIDGEIVPITDDDLQYLLGINNRMASEAKRVIALFARPVSKGEDVTDIESMESNLIVLGLVGIIDPPRPEVFDAIAICQNAGIRVKMITGDQQLTAQAIGIELNITDGKVDPLSCQQIEAMSDDELADATQNASIFSRVTPEQKMRIVTCLQDDGEVVAMTGDGVNDAPALSRANIGIAMGIAGTDVAKDAADMVLQDDNFANIVHAVEEGRKIYTNIRNFVRYQVSTNVAAVALIIFSTFVFGWNLPLTATQILVINILMDGPPAVALGVEKRHARVMDRPPRPISEGLPNFKDLVLIFYLGTIMVVGTLLVYYLAGGGLPDTPCTGIMPVSGSSGEQFVTDGVCDEGAWGDWQQGHLQHAMTMAFGVFIVFQLFNVINCRSNEDSVFKIGLFSNRFIYLAISISMTLLLLAIQGADYIVPFTDFAIGELLSTTILSKEDWFIIFSVSSSVFLIEEFRKLLVYSKFFKVTGNIRR